MNDFDQHFLLILKRGFEQTLDQYDDATEQKNTLLMVAYSRMAFRELTEIIDRFPDYQDEIVNKQALVTIKNLHRKDLSDCISEIIDYTNSMVKKAGSDEQKIKKYKAGINKLKRVLTFKNRRPRLVDEYISLFEQKIDSLQH
jgi:hypothetical protein